MSSKKQVYKSSVTGKIVSKKYAIANPDTTYLDTVGSKKKKIFEVKKKKK